MGAWIRHLVLQVVAADPLGEDFSDKGLDTYLVGRPGKSDISAIARFTRVELPEQSLAQLVRLFRDGRRAPLPLFPIASREYVERTLSGRDREDALDRAKRKYVQDQPVSGEGLNPYNVLAFRGVDPFDPVAQLAGDHRFDELADSVFAPLLAARKDVE